MEDPAAGAPAAVAAVPAAVDDVNIAANMEVFLNYLRKTMVLILGSGQIASTQPSPGLFEDRGSQEAVRKFITDPMVRVILVQKVQRKDEEPENDASDAAGEVSYTISTEIAYKAQNVGSVAILKRGAVIDVDKDIPSQLIVFDLKDGSPHEVFHAVIAGIMSPFFKSFIRSESGSGKENDKIVNTAEKKLAELETVFLHLQQNIGIPEVVLVPHPTVAAVIKKAAEEGRKATVQDFDQWINDPNFLNQLQNGVNRWIREIQKVTKLDRDPSTGSTLQEISFWLSMETALQKIQEKRDSLEVTLTLELLKQGRRFHAVVSFDADTGLQQMIDLVSDYCILMKDFPIQELLTATSLEKIRDAIRLIFIHMRKIRNTKYPVTRCQHLVEALSRDMTTQMLKVLGTRYLMHYTYPEFEKVIKQCADIFMTWSDEFEKVSAIMRDLVKKKREENVKLVWRASTGAGHKHLQTRMEAMKKFRWGHQQLCSVITRVLQPGVLPSVGADELAGGDKMSDEAQSLASASAIEEVNLAYECVKEVDCLDTSKEGQEAWDQAIKRYEDRVDKVESKITERLRDQLGSARNANEMFRIFSQYSALLVRPRIRGAIREYQTQLIQKVKEDIEYLHDKFKVGYQNTGNAIADRQRDFPPVAGCILWTRHIERHLLVLLSRIEHILGRGWENHVEGQKLKADGDSFRKKLQDSMTETFEAWSQRMQQRPLAIAGRIFLVENQRVRGSNVLRLRIDFHPEIISLWKEVRNLKWLGFRVPMGTVQKSYQTNQLYPFAVSLIESVRAYERTCNIVASKPTLSLLVSGLKANVQASITEGADLVWESHRVEAFVQKFSETTSIFQEKVDDLVLLERQIDVELRSLDTCLFNTSSFADILNKIQKTIDDLSLRQYSNLADWTVTIDEEVEQKLAARLQTALVAWLKVLNGKEDELQNTDTDDSPTSASLIMSIPKIEKVVHEFRIANQVMFLNPPVPQARTDLLAQLWNWASTILAQKRLQSSRYRSSVNVEEEQLASTYQSVLQRLPSPQVLIEIFAAVDGLIAQVEAYVQEWLRYQALWDLQPEMVYERLGTDMEKWIQILTDIKKSRATFDTSDTSKTIGPIVVDFARVQSKVTLKYDQWHTEVINKYGSLLGQTMQDFYGLLNGQRSTLEHLSLDAASTAESVNLITSMQTMKRKLKGWEKQVELFRDGQKLLERQRFKFPNKWLHSENLDSEWGAFTDILKRKDNSVQQKMGQLQNKIAGESRILETKTTEILANWDTEKPVDGALRPETALSQITAFDQRLKRLKEERENLSRAKEALDMQPEGTADPHLERIVVCIEELDDLKGVWSEVAKIWKQIDELKETSWVSVQPRKVRQTLDTLLGQLKEMPSRMRQYASYDFVKQLLQSYTKVNVLIVELKSEALKDRHWSQLMRQMGVKWNLSDLTLGAVWDTNLQRHERTIRDVMMTAQGELALENFLKQVKETWQIYELELIPYQDKAHLIRGWDDLFNKVKEHINSLQAMKLSPYYKVFEEDAVAWEEKLNKINSVFDIWIDVQRRWVYLDGIFSGSTDIQALLPTETSRFHSISNEFLGVMKKVAKSPKVLEVVGVTGLQRSLERILDLLSKIQKALGEYLERQRSSFPRFYFVGDEDLLDIIGNSKNLVRIQKHFKKMFAGINALIIDAEQTVVDGFSSKEGEEVKFSEPLVVAKFSSINDLLITIEKEMKRTLAKLLYNCIRDAGSITSQVHKADYLAWMDKYPAQIVLIAAQVQWSQATEEIIKKMGGDGSGGRFDLESMQKLEASIGAVLNILADSVLEDHLPIMRKKMENLITEYVHKRDVTRLLIEKKVDSRSSFQWLKQMRFSFNPQESDVLKQLNIEMANARFFYGFEYLGVQDKLVQTPLTDRCYLAMTQALASRLGGSPFGPAGTGKTETVKALGQQMGRFVLVFNCDETFDFQAMGRIFIGLCQVGAWGCFDEFNRLEERMLSAVSQQIQTIQEGLRRNADLKSGDIKSIPVDLLGNEVHINPDMAIFVTMNPGYAGRSNLPDNLKKLFRSFAMTKPDRQLIAEVMLFSQGFRTAEKLAAKVVPFFKLCDEQLSHQSHYDFGLRALKYVLVSAGIVKRLRVKKIQDSGEGDGAPPELSALGAVSAEQQILVQSVCETMVPKLIAEDIPLMFSLLADVFPKVAYERSEMDQLKALIKKACDASYLVAGEKGGVGAAWMEKVLQLYQISQVNHGLMMVGPSGSGKTAAWQILLKALTRLEGVEGVAHVIDPKAMSKEALYGYLDPNTREWTDGLFTHILRKIVDNVRGEIHKRQWIIFDGDVDPDWVENLNSVLDDNKILTLPNGERLGLPPNVRIMFEVQDLRFATMATVSRCGMIWFNEDVVTIDMVFYNYLTKLQNVVYGSEEAEATFAIPGVSPQTPTSEIPEERISPELQVQRDIVNILRPHLAPEGLVVRCLDFASEKEHIMDFTRIRALNALLSMINQTIREVHNYNSAHSDFPMAYDQLEQYVTKSLVYAMLWSLTGDSKKKVREELGDFVRSVSTIRLPPQSAVPIIDYEIGINGEWTTWQSKVPQMEVETHRVTAADLVIPTIDTVRHQALLYAWLQDHKPLILCGPPGSGKTMTLFSALRSLPNMEVVGLNFSSASTPELLLKTFDHYCEYRKTPNGVVLAPLQTQKWLVLFCDEINLPDEDKFGTQRVISFIRQLVERGGFYRTSDQAWVQLERIQFVGACNPPTDPGRKPLSQRFLRHAPVIYVDYPGAASLKQIYGTFNRAMLRLFPALRSYADPLTTAMVEFYLESQEKFTQEMQPHYIYSPRELTRWVRGVFEAIQPVDDVTADQLVRIWAHEGLRLFQDRLVEDAERRWTDENIDRVAERNFPGVDLKKSLTRPILYSNWMNKNYSPVGREDLREFVRARLKVFYEEELDVPLVLFDEVLDHVLRIDRIFRQPQGHVLLIGISGFGKTTLSRFVAWMNGLSIYQIKAHSKYTAADFDDDLRHVLRRSGCRDEKICFILDESNVLESSFLERMNTLLANGEVPGLFEGDEYTTLMTQCKEGSQREGLMLDTPEELYRWFTGQVIRNLHVVFTMNPSTQGLKDRASTSPALFNRCVVNWCGDWSSNAMYQVGSELTDKVDLDRGDYKAPDRFPPVCGLVPITPSHRQAVVNAFVYVHKTLQSTNQRLQQRGNRVVAITPRQYLDLINHFVKIYHEKRNELEDQQLHLNIGLQKIRETVEQVEDLRKELAVKGRELMEKDNAATAKLKQMLADQQEAERNKLKAEEIKEELKRKQEGIEISQQKVQNELATVEPLLLDAQNAVKGIKKQNLVEVKSMANPPPLVKLATESVCFLLGETNLDWKNIRTVMVRDNFIQTILNFKAETLTDAMIEEFNKQYGNNVDYQVDKINRASTACGPLAQWAIAQSQYAKILNQIAPLREKMATLQRDAEDSKHREAEVRDKLVKLEKSIQGFRDEYAVLIREAEQLKLESAAVQAKVNRSESLLKSLESESHRWTESQKHFKDQMATLIGDALLSAAFITYSGFYDQHVRSNVQRNWSKFLKNSGVLYRPDLSLTEYLSTPDDRLRWLANGLPADDLCIENAIMLSRFNRYPLIIDPSGQATDFVLNELKTKKIARTSFLDSAFRKNLESALRFGNPLLVQDVENYDPILNSVLNREVKRNAGRILIQLGDQDIDLSPTFSIYLATRDPSVEFPPDVCSRVTFVNFTVTRSSLQSQCLHHVLRSERPDIDEKRTNMLKLQGEFRLKLRHLEQSLLQALNEAKGKILDDDNVLTTLERLKHEAAEVQQKVDETDQIMGQIEKVSQEYMPLAVACSSVFFTLDVLNQVHFLYNYSLQFFIEIFNNTILNNPNLISVRDPAARLQRLTSDLFFNTFERVSRGMQHEDQLVLAVLLARIFLKSKHTGTERDAIHDEEFEFLLRGIDAADVMEATSVLDGFTAEESAQIMHLGNLKYFKNVKELFGRHHDSIQKWKKAGGEAPEIWKEHVTNADPAFAALLKVLLTQAVRPDLVRLHLMEYVDRVFGPKMLHPEKEVLDLATIVNDQVKAQTPIMLCSKPGYDASWLVDDLAADLTKQMSSIALGSAEGFEQADKAVVAASKAGRWVLLKNVHLAPSWLVSLEKRLHSLQHHPAFRLFLTAEMHPALPVTLLRSSRVLVFEPSTGIKANLQRTLNSIPVNRMTKEPVERARLYFLLTWLNGVIQERLRYVPLGWSKAYEFTEADLRMACDVLDTWLDRAAQGRTNITADKIPWEAIATLLSQCVYGGKIDNDFDQRLLTVFVDSVFSLEAFHGDLPLVTGEEQGMPNVPVPDGSRRDQFEKWIGELRDHSSPEWIGLPGNAENVLLIGQGKECLAKLLKLQLVEDEEEKDVVEESLRVTDSKKESESMEGPAWMKSIQSLSQGWLRTLPADLVQMKRTPENIKDPLFRCFAREVKLGGSILSGVKRDLNDLMAICKGIKKQTNYHRVLVSDLLRGIIPKSWKRYTVPINCTVNAWFADFVRRIQQLNQIASLPAKDLKSLRVWLGGLFLPEACITATRQFVAQANSWPLEELQLDTEVLSTGEKVAATDKDVFYLTGMHLQGALAEGKTLRLSGSLFSDMPVCAVRWVRQEQNDSALKIPIPVYLYSDRANLLFTLDFAPQDASKRQPDGLAAATAFYKRGVAVIASPALA
ncbi:dynein heavy chain, cytoplasmic-like [Paramacrobiotus metropolitanus]|uniref:dynein heavy chain, cytoplasmic-like n=1 Tax=Paramacrobiotus metropolitanus TaxID=2943436 RepID=UPI0024460776|nr:dynein heavy chain, cytoplasmic-like [Paramacrobiotus metropolitanus]